MLFGTATFTTLTPSQSAQTCILHILLIHIVNFKKDPVLDWTTLLSFLLEHSVVRSLLTTSFRKFI